MADKLGYDCLDYDNNIESLEQTVQRIGGEIKYLEDGFIEDDNLSLESGSLLVHDITDFTIILPSFTSRLRDRFTIGHELGHYFLHSSQGQRPILASRYGSGRLEWEANWFSAGFLMPEEKVSKLWVMSWYLLQI